ncbi:NnrU family protein [Woodsholea maritima]|uniref:NnrU family protein n=1 Tax=Woodsholea maritima TaxID=240237 RepID=UPI0003793B16|nr:NnrU family protein [Woodsholea maritima]
MTVLIIGLILFLGIHSVRLLGIREFLLALFGDGLYMVIYSIISTIGLVFIVYGHILAHPSEVLWYPPELGREVALIAMPIAFILLIATYVPSHIRSIIRHPMMLATVLWSGSHVAANGTLAGTVLFGSFFAWSVLASIQAYARGGTFKHSGGFFSDLIVIVVGLAAAALVAHFHMNIFGVAVFDVASKLGEWGILPIEAP